MVFQENINVQYILAKDTIDLRSKILRPGQSVELCNYAEDNFDTTFHLGIFFNNKIICNGTFIKNICPTFPLENSAYRLRGMATDVEFQGLNFGSRLLAKAEEILKHKQCRLLWFNARATAFKFYEKNGYQSFGELFDIPGIGDHKIMYQWLD
jgi:GNAT superfamily N-acetyltransferase